MKNVKFSDILREREVAIPDTEIVLTVKDLSWPDFLESMDIEDMAARGLYRIEKVIQDWNLVDKDGKKIEITKENLEKIPANIMIPIVNAVKDCFGEQKKKITVKN